MVVVVVGEGGEGLLGVPGEVGVDRSGAAVLVDLDDAVAGEVEVVAGVAVGAVHVVVEGEGEDEGGVDAAGVEGLQELAQVVGLAGLVALVVAVQADGALGGVFDDVQAERAPVARAA